MKRPENRLREVSIPIGFSSSLQRLRSNWIQNQSQSFNPYRVFKFVATLNPFAYPFLRHVVSIPIGFSSSLQLENPVHGRIISFSFNPYRVFKFVATFWLSSVHSGYWSVSIPIGFSSSLQPELRSCRIPQEDPVSIPIGFSSSLQRICYVGLPENTDKVSIPIGFSSSLQRLTGRSKSARSKSFNPYRVFKFVATQFVVTTSEKPNGFNPYRVFKFVATQPSRSRTGLTSLFQSLSGFQVRCNIEDPIFFDREEAVSIPIGFSSSLQLGGIFFFRANKS